MKTITCNENKKITVKIDKICAIELEHGEYFHKVIIFLENGKEIAIDCPTKEDAEKIYTELTENV